ncbi:SCO family protein [Ciceribacter azotifigens]|uniref:SCO family protein n=1 Tax=Ciceribacter azotifigens TaxID=2069303 RepID=UPI003A86905B
MTTMEADGHCATTTRIARIAILAFLVLGVAGITFMLASPGRVQVAVKAVSPIDGPSTLATQTELSDTDPKGKSFAVAFGFTRCPAVCPRTLWEMTQTFKKLGPDPDQPKILFISVDPTRSTPEFLARYLPTFGPHVTGLPGTAIEIASVAMEYRIYHATVPTDDGDYAMNHTATISYGEDMSTRLQKLRCLSSGTA